MSLGRQESFLKMKFINPTALVLLVIPLAFAGPVNRQPHASFKIVYDQNFLNSFSDGLANLRVAVLEDSIIVSSSLGNMKMKKTNESFVLESISSPNDIAQSKAEAELEKGGKDSEKYDIVNEKLQETTTTESPIKNDCMESPLKHFIISCDGNIRLRRLTEEERMQSKQWLENIQEQMRQRIEAFKNRMSRIQEILRENFQRMRKSLLGL